MKPHDLRDQYMFIKTLAKKYFALALFLLAPLSVNAQINNIVLTQLGGGEVRVTFDTSPAGPQALVQSGATTAFGDNYIATSLGGGTFQADFFPGASPFFYQARELTTGQVSGAITGTVDPTPPPATIFNLTAVENGLGDIVIEYDSDITGDRRAACVKHHAGLKMPRLGRD